MGAHLMREGKRDYKRHKFSDRIVCLGADKFNKMLDFFEAIENQYFNEENFEKPGPEVTMDAVGVAGKSVGRSTRTLDKHFEEDAALRSDWTAYLMKKRFEGGIPEYLKGRSKINPYEEKRAVPQIKTGHSCITQFPDRRRLQELSSGNLPINRLLKEVYPSGGF